MEDFLGSSRVMTAATDRTVCYDADFLPFGQERIVVNNCAQNYKFTGKERDTETGNDDFGARSYSSSMGRWLSADWSAIPAPVPYANLTNPQTLNFYAMVRDNPETFTDLDGHEDPVPVTGPDPSLTEPSQQATAPQQNSNSTTTVTLNSRPADIPGGQLLHDLGVNHEWISTPDGTDVGMGTAKGVPQSDAPGVQTQVVDHTGQVPTSTQTFTRVDKGALSTYTQVGTPTGRWVPGVNDCNTWAHTAINQSTPHNITVSIHGVPIVIAHNVVVYANGSVHSPGGP